MCIIIYIEIIIFAYHSISLKVYIYIKIMRIPIYRIYKKNNNCGGKEHLDRINTLCIAVITRGVSSGAQRACL